MFLEYLIKNPSSHCSGFVLATHLASAPATYRRNDQLSALCMQPSADVTTWARAARPPNQSLLDTHTQTRAASGVAGDDYSRLPHLKRLSCSHLNLLKFTYHQIQLNKNTFDTHKHQ